MLIIKIVVSDKFEHSEKGFKYSIGYKDDNIVGPLCIILPQMSGYIKYFDNGGKNTSFVIEDEGVLVKCNDFWNKIFKMLGIRSHSVSVYDEKHLKTKVNEFDVVVNTNLWGDEVPKECVHYACMTCINIYFLMKIEKINYPKVI